VLGPGTALGGRYVLEERLEHGRLGVVYRAFDRHGPRARVALLVLPSEVAANERLTAAVRRDFDRIRALRHPAIVEVLGLERDGDIWFFVLELVEGETLATVLDNLRPDELHRRDALAVLRAVGAALDHAHAHGVVHGDVRPENVIVSSIRDVKLSFAPTCLLRSPPFTLDTRDDVFGLGCLAYELLGGRAPVGGYHAPSGPEREYEPRRPEGLTRAQWRALRDSLAPRERRPRSVRTLLAGLGVDLSRSRFAVPREARRNLGRAAVLGAVAFGIGAAALERERLLEWLEPERLVGWAGAAPESIDRMLGPVEGLVERGQTEIAARVADLRAVYEARLRDARETENESAEPAAPPGAVPAPTAEPALPADAGPARGEAEREEPAAAEPEAARADDGRAAAPEAVVRGGAAGPEGAATTVGRTDEPEPGASTPAVPAAPARAARVRAAAAGPRAGAEEPGTATFVRGEAVVSEGASAVALEIRRTNPAGGELSIAWWTSDGTAVAGEDYADLGAVIETFAPGEASRTIYVPITNDSVIEDPEVFYVSLREGLESRRPAIRQAITRMTVTIIDDDR